MRHSDHITRRRQESAMHYIRSKEGGLCRPLLFLFIHGIGTGVTAGVTVGIGVLKGFSGKKSSGY